MSMIPYRLRTSAAPIAGLPNSLIKVIQNHGNALVRDCIGTARLAPSAGYVLAGRTQPRPGEQGFRLKGLKKVPPPG